MLKKIIYGLIAVAASVVATAGPALADAAPPAGPPAVPNFQSVGATLANAQMMFVGSPDKVFILDKPQG